MAIRFIVHAVQECLGQGSLESIFRSFKLQYGTFVSQTTSHGLKA